MAIDHKRTEICSVRLTEQESHDVERLAVDRDMSISDLFRSLLLKEFDAESRKRLRSLPPATISA